MALPIGKLAPTAVVAAMVTYCCWPHLNAPVAGKGQETRKLPEIAATLLSPVTTEPPDRDPFQAQSKPSTIAAKSDEAKTSDGHDTPHQSDTSAPVHGDRWVLNGTLLRGERRLAVINGKLYATGESLAASDSPDSSYVVAQIDGDKVVIRGPGQTVDLYYEDLSAMSGAGHKTSGPTRNVPQATTKRTSPNHAATKPSPKQSDKRHE